jgi:hypothetical protein
VRGNREDQGVGGGRGGKTHAHGRQYVCMCGGGTHRSRMGRRMQWCPLWSLSTYGLKVPSLVPVLQRHHILCKGKWQRKTDGE